MYLMHLMTLNNNMCGTDYVELNVYEQRNSYRGETETRRQRDGSPRHVQL
jgi:hypothetical protein